MKALLIVLISFMCGVPSFAESIVLEAPKAKGTLSLEQCITDRKTSRFYKAEPLSKALLSQLLWAGNGLLQMVDGTTRATPRTIPSARKTYPIELYAVITKNGVNGVHQGVYQYNPSDHKLNMITQDGSHEEISAACNGQSWMKSAPLMIVICGVFHRSEQTSGPKRGLNFAVMESGNANQNIILQAQALGLGSNTVAGLNDDLIAKILKIPPDVRPLMIVTVGYSQDR